MRKTALFNNNPTYQLIARISELEVGGGRRKLVYHLVDLIAQSRILVSLQVCLEVILHETFVDLAGALVKLS